MGRYFPNSIFLPVLLSALLFGLIAVSCTRAQKSIEIRTGDGSTARLAITETLRVKISAEPSTLDWTISADATASEITMNLMEGLVKYDLSDKNLGLQPALALSWSSRDAAREWVLKLRPNVRWSDGEILTAQHVVDGFKRLLDRKTASPYAYFVFGIKNARSFNEGKVAFSDVGIKIVSPEEIKIRLERPMSFFPSLLTHHSTWPVRLDLIEKYGARWTDPGKLVSLGSYTLKSWEHDYLVALERNETYYGESAKTKYVVNYIVQEQATAINLYDAGKFDVVDRIQAVDWRKLQGRPDFFEVPSLNLYFYFFNVKKPPMDNVLVRKAFIAAIDRGEIVRLLGGSQRELRSWIPEGMIGHEPGIGIPFDPERAKDLLKQAGYGERAKFPRLQIIFNTAEDHRQIAENIQEQLKRHLGIRVELQNVEWKMFLSMTKSDPPQVFRYGWLADYPDPDNFFSLMLSFSENNHSRWQSSAFDDLVLRASSETDPAARARLYREAQKILIEDEAPVMPIFSRVEGTLIAPRVENFPLNSMTLRIYRGVRLK